jgi:hypothetical protein
MVESTKLRLSAKGGISYLRSYMGEWSWNHSTFLLEPKECHFEALFQMLIDLQSWVFQNFSLFDLFFFWRIYPQSLLLEEIYGLYWSVQFLWLVWSGDSFFYQVLSITDVIYLILLLLLVFCDFLMILKVNSDEDGRKIWSFWY